MAYPRFQLGGAKRAVLRVWEGCVPLLHEAREVNGFTHLLIQLLALQYRKLYNYILNNGSSYG